MANSTASKYAHYCYLLCAGDTYFLDRLKADWLKDGYIDPETEEWIYPEEDDS